MNIEKNIPLGTKTTFRIGGIANNFVEIKTTQDLLAALAYAKVQKLKTYILGGGSNILVSDSGFSGLVIKNSIKGIKFDDYPKTVDCTACAGESWDDVVAHAVLGKFGGIENLSLIPGTVGGAIVQNIGAYGSEVKDVVQWVDTINIDTGLPVRFGSEDCHFSYRNSFFKTPEGRKYIIVSATFRFEKDALPKIVYKDLVEYFKEKNIPQTLEQARRAVIAIRRAKLPDIKEVGTAGSFFKNPIISKKEFVSLKERYPELPSFVIPTSPAGEEQVKVPLGFIIDKICGLKGYRQDEAGIYEKQALVLVNYGSATQKDIDALAGLVSRTVFEKTGLTIEREVESIK